MTKKHQILVIGHDDEGCKPDHEKMAYETGTEIAKSGAVLITGGLGGVMKAASHGAHDAGGFVIGIIPQNDPLKANEYCDVVIPTGMGHTRDFLTALSADGVIVIGGGSGTLTEVCASYVHKKPIAALKNSGDVAAKYADQYLDHRNHVKIVGVDSPKDAVKYILEQIAK
jgi:hypothetical protein